MPTTINPATGEPLHEYPYFSPAETEARLAQAHERFLSWRRLSVADRADHLRALAKVLRDQADAGAELMADEMGKPLAQGRAEMNKCATLCEHYAEAGPAMLAPESVEVEGATAYVSHQPLGVLLTVMPWNFPWWQALRCAVPALLAGNTVLLQHAANVTGSAFAIEHALRTAGFPQNCLSTLVIDHGATAELIGDPRVVGVSLTGSTRAGKAVGEAAGRYLKKTVLELGGSDPYLILEDADIELAAEICAKARLQNSGQTCVAAKRMIVCAPVADAFCEAFSAALQQAVVGDPHAKSTTVGPMARHDLRDSLHDQVQRSVSAGALLRFGGQLPEGPGAYYPVTLLDNVRPGMPAGDEELFGPVAAIMRVQTEEEAIAVANGSVYGLGAAVFSRDRARAEVIARDRLEAGVCVVNDFVRSDPRMPFGGVKQSGHGHELGRRGLLEWVHSKTVLIS
ncbi:NAD-dependent succinate-semialdehyde dehydrogenase [Pseudenhygromyxa sp. WMMC2535]|uniref:aldehyde dehydrogenase family protein n=1 Tax=Pseudenhygromyxa sp. WMMC2535 TaxID=2712867 RepID=UPI0015552E00|nr:NAD-dependent succinate-semialdehyde dehydrogenase [Pseudenhygromyxa sp. WMMC2535]